MKILMVSMNNLHFRRWSDQLRDSGHEVFWFDILDQGYAPSLEWMTQITGWKKGFLKTRGRTFLKRKLPKIYYWLSKNFDHKAEEAFEKALLNIQPDVVHSFALYISCTPIIQVMERFTRLKWIYSSWGSDLYYFRQLPNYLRDIKRVLARIDFLFTDCNRDHCIAVDLGFEGKFLGVFPGGGGYDLEQIRSFYKPYESRKVILLKGNENRSGRALNILKALERISSNLSDFEVVVFGATNPKILCFDQSKIPNIQIHGLLKHEEVQRLMGTAAIYIGNSNSDGMPNTLLEAICAGAFPIQSNPGGATSEIIVDGVNGSLIHDCEDLEHILQVIQTVLTSKDHRLKAANQNVKNINPILERQYIQNKVLNAYDSL